MTSAVRVWLLVGAAVARAVAAIARAMAAVCTLILTAVPQPRRDELAWDSSRVRSIVPPSDRQRQDAAADLGLHDEPLNAA
jgi:hypothetical protein